MKEIRIVPTRDSINSCSICYARNYEPQKRNPLGEYKPVLFDLHIGNQVMCLCPDCMKILSGKIDEVIERRPL